MTNPTYHPSPLRECNRLHLAHWRRTVAELYAEVRHSARIDPRGAWHRFREERDRLFRQHPQTPLTAAQIAAFVGLAYYPYDPALRVIGQITPARGPARVASLPEGELCMTPVAVASFRLYERQQQLTLFWIEGYGGGLFLPFADRTNGDITYGGGRYLYDTIKGADLGVNSDTILLDFNFAYNPSCAYNSRWSCPLAPPENRLDIAITAGEQRFDAIPFP